MSEPSLGFSELDLAEPLVKAVTELGYESPLPIQAACIPHLLEGRDVLGLAQTGTGKTGAFALPLLSMVDLSNRSPQVLVLTPTRELAIQVAEAFQAYARYMKDFHVLPIYGGQRYSFQFSQLHRGPHVIVGTPGRILDHLSRKTLDLSGIKTLVLDEADEMLRMGFVDDVETIMAQAPEGRQMALFSATMPPQIRRISQKYLQDPAEVRIQTKTNTAENIEQVYLVVHNSGKFEALVRILETESYDGILIFSRTRISTTELAEKLAARGFDVAPLNGEMSQQARERTVSRLKKGQVDIVVATDVAARGLDVERISLVINYDIPGDSETYIHRIGRTGRVGRYGKAILFASPRERYLLKSIERATRKSIDRMEMPSHDEVTKKRIEKFRDNLYKTMDEENMDFFHDLSFELMEQMNIDLMQLAAGLLCYAQKDRPLQVKENRALANQDWQERGGNRDRDRGGRGRDRDRGRGRDGGRRDERDGGPGRPQQYRNMHLYRVEVGSLDGVEVRNIVGAVVNETGIQNRFIGQIRIHPKYSTIELPDDVPGDIIKHLRTVYVAKKALKISRTQNNNAPASSQASSQTSSPAPSRSRKSRPMGIDDFEAPGSRAPRGRHEGSPGLKGKSAKGKAKKPKKPKKPKA